MKDRMRIVAGIFGGRRIQVPKGRSIRPTSDKVRGAIFNALESRGVVDGAQVLDCFCGTGALGLEALSRGAAGCTFIDKNRSSLDLAKENAHSLGAEATFLLKDSAALSGRPEGLVLADLVFVDPPYERDMVFPTLLALDEKSWLAEDAIVVVEAEKVFSGALPQGYDVLAERVYKDTKILTLRYNIPL